MFNILFIVHYYLFNNLFVMFTFFKNNYLSVLLKYLCEYPELVI
jgi:hypothetical protein